MLLDPRGPRFNAAVTAVVFAAHPGHRLAAGSALAQAVVFAISAVDPASRPVQRCCSGPWSGRGCGPPDGAGAGGAGPLRAGASASSFAARRRGCRRSSAGAAACSACVAARVRARRRPSSTPRSGSAWAARSTWRRRLPAGRSRPRVRGERRATRPAGGLELRGVGGFEQAEPQRGHQGLGPVGRAELLVQLRDVGLGRRLARRTAAWRCRRRSCRRRAAAAPGPRAARAAGRTGRAGASSPRPGRRR